MGIKDERFSIYFFPNRKSKKLRLIFFFYSFAGTKKNQKVFTAILPKAGRDIQRFAWTYCGLFNERIAGSIKALHVGIAYGTFTRIIYFIACLIATSLPVTGTIWFNKLKEKRRRKSREFVKVSIPYSSTV